MNYYVLKTQKGTSRPPWFSALQALPGKIGMLHILYFGSCFCGINSLALIIIIQGPLILWLIQPKPICYVLIQTCVGVLDFSYSIPENSKTRACFSLVFIILFGGYHDRRWIPDRRLRRLDLHRRHLQRLGRSMRWRSWWRGYEDCVGPDLSDPRRMRGIGVGRHGNGMEGKKTQKRMLAGEMCEKYCELKPNFGLTQTSTFS